MMRETETKTTTGRGPSRLIKYRDLFKGDFWRYFLRAVWLFFPAILFLVFAYLCFWKLSQGRDVMIVTLENRNVFGLFLLGLVFWVLIIWYTSRIVAKAKEAMSPDPHALWVALRVHGPRILAFTAITIVILAFLQLPYPETPEMRVWVANILFFLSFPWYFVVYRFMDRILRHRPEKPARSQILKWQKIRLGGYAILSLSSLAVMFTDSFPGLIILLLAYQAGLIAMILIRRNIISLKNEYSFVNGTLTGDFRKLSFRKRFALILNDKEDRRYFQALNVVSIVAAVIYFATIFSVSFSVRIGSFPFLFLAFGVLIGLGNFVALMSVLKRFNFHVLLVTIAFLVGLISEPHYTRLPKKPAGVASFDQRQSLKEYFKNWLKDPARQKLLQDSSGGRYPVYFVLANGGASRSGYWAASVLGNLEDATQGRFSKHLFCLSGASGGSVGNATFFSLLRAQDRLRSFDGGPNRYLNAAKDYLRSDFLTFTLARTLGPDIFRNFFTLYNVNDRASALSFALEKGSGKKSFLYDSLGVPFSRIMTRTGEPYALPLLLINTTRMQDGSPGLISNLKVDDTIFNQRIDVLKLLRKDRDMNLSTGVVLGASFPYLSPAGRIDHKPCDTCATEPNYFVDGGYFDNSGSGAVFEIIFSLQQLLKTPEFAAYRDKFDFTVLHITNDQQSKQILKEVNPFTNDLAAPVTTLLGAYGTQTYVNDYRLQKYLGDIYGEKDSRHYRHLSLYRENDSLEYTMSWVISGHVLRAMDQRLATMPELKALKTEMQTTLR